MKKITEKLKSTSGVSILFALLGMMVAIVISTVLVNAALTNAERASRTRQQNQEYLVMESAVKLAKEMVSDCKVTFQYKETTTYERQLSEADAAPEAGGVEEAPAPGGSGGEDPGEGDPEEEVSTESSWEYVPGSVQISGIPDGTSANPLAKALLAGITEALTGSGSASGNEQILVGINAGDEEKASFLVVNFDVVNVYTADLSQDEEPDADAISFDIAIEGSLKQKEDSGTGLIAADYADSVTLTASGRCMETGSTIAEGTFSTKEKAGEAVTVETRTDVTTHTYTVSWDDILVKKGLTGHEAEEDETV